MVHFLAPEAAADLDHIWYYIATESGSTERADRFLDALTERFYMLSTHPRLGRKRDDLRTGLRSFPVGDYLIIYRITAAEDVLISYVTHGRQDLQRLVSS
jgi:toxin ParE1/3/4